MTTVPVPHLEQVRRQEVMFDSQGVRCAAWLSQPRVSTSTCVVMGHGFSLIRHDAPPEFAVAFARAGHAVPLVDYRHFGDSGGVPGSGCGWGCSGRTGGRP